MHYVTPDRHWEITGLLRFVLLDHLALARPGRILHLPFTIDSKRGV